MPTTLQSSQPSASHRYTPPNTVTRKWRSMLRKRAGNNRPSTSSSIRLSRLLLVLLPPYCTSLFSSFAALSTTARTTIMTSRLRIHIRRNAAVPLFLLCSERSSSSHSTSRGSMRINRNAHTFGLVSPARSTLLSSSASSSCPPSTSSASHSSSPLQACSLFSFSSSPRMRPFTCSTTRLFSSSSSSSSPSSPLPSSSLYTSTIISAEEMERLGEGLWEAGLAAGHTVLLYGDLGTGKTALARGFIQAATAAGEEGEGGTEGAVTVTSPSYLLDNSYQAWDGETGEIFLIHHMDLYRLSKEKHDLKILGFPLVLKEALCLIEWPERLGSYTPATRLEVTLTALDENTRTVVVRGVGGGWAGEVVGRLEDVMKEE